MMTGRQGLALMLRSGLGAWLSAWSEVVYTPNITPARSTAYQLKNETVVDQMIAIIATMALNSESEVYA